MDPAVGRGEEASWSLLCERVVKDKATMAMSIIWYILCVYSTNIRVSIPPLVKVVYPFEQFIDI